MPLHELKERLPDDDTIYFLGVVSIITSFVTPVFSLIPSIIGMMMANKAIAVYNKNPEQYNINSYDKIMRGKRMSKIGVYITIIMFVLLFLLLFAIIAGLIGLGIFGFLA